jgi:hypothetical protein
MFPTVAFTSANYSIAALRSCLPHFQRAITKYNMAEAASAVPTFKLVLVGDGGTGKVRSIDLPDVLLLVVPDGIQVAFFPKLVAHIKY